MLDQLVESRDSYGDGKRRGGFLLMTMMLVAALFASGVLWSLFAKELGIGNEILELSAVIAPIPTEEPPAPEPITKEAKPQSIKNDIKLTTRRENILQISDSTIAPKEVSTAPLTNKERPRGTFTISSGDEVTASSSSSRGRGNTGTGSGENIGINQVSGSLAEEISKDEPPQIVKKETPAPKPQAPQSLGVVNGKATYLPKPAYPAAAQAVRAGGSVSVQVTIDESGRVISARAVDGHPLLKNVAENAARNAKFNPTLLSNTPVKVTGVIIYKFQIQ